MTKREIYYIIFNKYIADGKIKADTYVLGTPCEIEGKIPKSITIKDGKVVVLFEDDCRHIFPYNESVEYLERPIVKKDADKTTDSDK
jgi:hypothetical protein